MRILFLHMHFKTPYRGGAIRSFSVAKHLASKSHEVEIISIHNENKYQLVEIDGFKVHFLPISYDNSFTIYKRILAFLKFNRLAYRLFKKLEPPDIIYAISTPLTIGVLAMRIANSLGIKFVFEVGDLWPEAPIQMGVIRLTLLKKYLYNLEKKIYLNASGIISLAPSITDYISNLTKTPTITVPNFSDREKFYLKDIPQNPFTIAYIGAIGKANNLEHLIEAAKHLDPNQFKIIIMGEGGEQEKISQLAAPLKNVEIKQFGNQTAVIETLNSSHAVYLSYKTIPVLETGSPNKFFDALAAGKLIILNFKGWLKDLIEENNCGFYTNPDTPNNLQSQLEPYLNREKLNLAQQNARTLSAQFDMKSSVEKIENFLKSFQN